MAPPPRPTRKNLQKACRRISLYAPAGRRRNVRKCAVQEDARLQPTTLNVEDDLTLPALGLPHANCILVASQHDPHMGTTFSELG